jgi:hypothetical protein
MLTMLGLFITFQDFIKFYLMTIMDDLISKRYFHAAGRYRRFCMIQNTTYKSDLG